MKRFINLLFLLAPLLASAQFPLAVRTTNGTSVGWTNSGTSTFNGPQAGPFAGISNSQAQVHIGMTGSVFTASTFYPSNTVLNAHTNLIPGGVTNYLLATSGTKIITGSNGIFANMRPGDDIVFKSDNNQVHITDVISTNTIQVWGQLNTTYAGIAWDYYPNAAQWKDINGNNGMTIANDGGITMITFSHVGSGGTAAINSGAFYIADGTNVWKIAPSSGHNGFSIFALGPTNIPQTPDAFTISAQNGNNYEAVWIKPTGILTTKWGYTNFAHTVLHGTLSHGTNAVSTWPTVAFAGGASATVNSNGTSYLLSSSPGSTAWTSTNLLAPALPTIYTGVTNIGSADTALLIPIGRTMPNTNYCPSFSLVGTVSAGVGFNYSALTTTNFIVNLSGALGADSGARWSVIHSP